MVSDVFYLPFDALVTTPTGSNPRLCITATKVVRVSAYAIIMEQASIACIVYEYYNLDYNLV